MACKRMYHENVRSKAIGNVMRMNYCASVYCMKLIFSISSIGIILQFICNVSDIVHHYSQMHFCICRAIYVQAVLGVVVMMIFHRHHLPHHLICWPCSWKVNVRWGMLCVPWPSIKHRATINDRDQSPTSLVISRNSKIPSRPSSRKLKSRSKQKSG